MIRMFENANERMDPFHMQAFHEYEYEYERMIMTRMGSMARTMFSHSLVFTL